MSELVFNVLQDQVYEFVVNILRIIGYCLGYLHHETLVKLNKSSLFCLSNLIRFLACEW